MKDVQILLLAPISHVFILISIWKQLHKQWDEFNTNHDFQFSNFSSGHTKCWWQTHTGMYSLTINVCKHKIKIRRNKNTQLFSSTEELSEGKNTKNEPKLESWAVRPWSLNWSLVNDLSQYLSVYSKARASIDSIADPDSNHKDGSTAAHRLCRLRSQIREIGFSWKTKDVESRMLRL